MDTTTGSRQHRWLTTGQGTWSARCVETRTAGAAGGSGKRAGRKDSTAPRPNPAAIWAENENAAFRVLRWKYKWALSTCKASVEPKMMALVVTHRVVLEKAEDFAVVEYQKTEWAQAVT